MTFSTALDQCFGYTSASSTFNKHGQGCGDSSNLPYWRRIARIALFLNLRADLLFLIPSVSRVEALENMQNLKHGTRERVASQQKQ